jgi:hypothetical protein
MRGSNCSISYTWEDEDNNRVLEFDIEGSVSKYIPAKISGPPENCYPAEGGDLEDWEITLVDGTVYDDDSVSIRAMMFMETLCGSLTYFWSHP